MFVIHSGIEMHCIMIAALKSNGKTLERQVKVEYSYLKQRRWPKSSPTWTCFLPLLVIVLRNILATAAVVIFYIVFVYRAYIRSVRYIFRS